MIFQYSDIFSTSNSTLVIPVNCVGVMGAGLARQCRQHWPEVFTQYQQHCQSPGLRPGCILPMPTATHQVILLATKNHWRQPSEISWVDQGLRNLRYWLLEHSVTDPAVPALGAGLGQLAWPSVFELICQHLGDFPGLTVYPPQ